MGIILYTIISVIVVSLISLIGAATLLKKYKSDKFLLMLVSLSAGTLFGGAFLHLLPEAVEMNGFGLKISLLLLAGVVVFFLLEKFIHWHHCHPPEKHLKAKHSHKSNAIAPLNLFGDAIHNFLDGLIIAGSYLISVPAGIATTVAVIFHEVPQEIADFGVLLYSGLSKWKALLLNFASAAVAIVGAIIGLILGSKSAMFVELILPFAAGGFVYIAGSNLIPELHKECELKDSLWHFLMLIIGILIMVALLFLGN
jgi:zinc and cadmium transporter